MRSFRVLLLASVLCFVFAVSVFAARYTVMTTDGLNGEELVCLAVSPVKNDLLLAGTSRSVYSKNKKEKIWRSLCGAGRQMGRVDQIYFAAEGRAYVAGENGLFLSSSDVSVCESIFSRSDQAENYCLSVVVSSDETIFVGTKGGLFFKAGKNDWSKIVSSFDKQEVVSLYECNNIVYAATPSSIYWSDDLGKSWAKVFNIYSYEQVNKSEEEEFSDAEKIKLPAVRQITGDGKDQSLLYAVTKEGIFKTVNGGKSWTSVPSAGLNASELRYLLLDSENGRKIAVTRTGFHILEHDGWKLLMAAYDAKMAVFHKETNFFLTGRDICDYSFSAERVDSQWQPRSEVALCDEPTIQEVQAMAIEYCDVSNEKIRDWRRRASKKAMMPEVSVDFDRTITTALGATYNRIQEGPMDWGVSVKWDLGDLVYSSDQTSIDSRAKLMVELRNDILSEVTRLYFERSKLQGELMSNKNDSGKNITEKELRLAELTALIDRLTGGQYSKLLKSPH